jgi:7,8-dihydropterin-6-yl-methyl-4-(beta-D-ribofuranosyl)aminobenzene 5'-phosphate synthase
MGRSRKIIHMSMTRAACFFCSVIALGGMFFLCTKVTIMTANAHQNDVMQRGASAVRLTVVYDNNSMSAGLRTAWGFACVIETGETKVLFDTGGEGALLLENMRRLGVDPADIDLVVLSHTHGDHTGGLSDFLHIHPRLPVYFPRSFPKSLSEEIKSAGATPVPVSSFAEIQPGIFTLGEFRGTIPEQALAVQTPKGLVIVTGCAHPGIVTILSRAKKVFGEEPVHLVIGGFHLLRSSREEILEIVKGFREVGVQRVAPCHCAGDTARLIFSEAYGKNYLAIGVGARIEIGSSEQPNK